MQGVPHTHTQKTLAGFGAINTTTQNSAVAFMRVNEAPNSDADTPERGHKLMQIINKDQFQ